MPALARLAETVRTMERQARKVRAPDRALQVAAAEPGAVAHPCDESSLRGAWKRPELGLIAPILVGPQRAHRGGGRASHGSTSRRFEVVDAPHSEPRPRRPFALAREGKAEALMKGSLHTDELMGAVVKRETGLRTSRRVSHCFVMDVPGHDRVAHHHRCGSQHRADARGQGRTSSRTRSTSRMRWAWRSRGWRSSRRWRRSTRRCRRRSRPRRCARWPTAARSPAALLDGPLALDNAINLDAAQDQEDRFAGRRAGRHPRRARSRSRQHAGQEPDVHGRRGCGRDRARRARADHPHQPGRFGHDAARFLRGGGAGRASARREQLRAKAVA